MTRQTEDGDKIWIIEEDSTHTPGVLVARRSAASMFGGVHVRRDRDYAESVGLPIERFVHSKTNIIDHETGERMR